MEGQKANWQLPIWKEDHREQPARHGGAQGGGGSSAGIHPWTIPVELGIRPVARETRQHANGQSNRLRRRSGHHVFRREERRGFRQGQHDSKDRQRLVHECRSHTGERKDGSHALGCKSSLGCKC